MYAIFLVSIFTVKCTIPTGKIAEKAVWRSVFWAIWRWILNADSTKTHSSVLLFSVFAVWDKSARLVIST